MENSNPKKLNYAEGLAQFDLFKYRVIVEMQRSHRLSSTFCIAAIHLDTPKVKGLVYPKSVLSPQIIDAIKTTVRNIDTFCKDERGNFLILLSETNDELATIVAKRILEKMTFLHVPEIETKVSIGISNYPNDSKTLDDILQAAKFAMFQASQQEKSNIITISYIRQGLSWEDEANDALFITHKRFNKLIETTIKSLLSTFAGESIYLKQHSIEVAQIASILAEHLGLKEDYIKEITFAALLHDIGYLELPNDILNKKTSLDLNEVNLIQQHPLIATEKILKPVKSLETVLPIILDHHERWDGTGYPNKKIKRDIHIGARILSIADAYQAMSSDRPYRNSLNRYEIIEKLEQGAGNIWEAKLTYEFISLLKNGVIDQSIFNE